MPNVSEAVRVAYSHAVMQLAVEGRGPYEGLRPEEGCRPDEARLLAAVLMHAWLREHGEDVHLVRYDVRGGADRWTVAFGGAEYDPSHKHKGVPRHRRHVEKADDNEIYVVGARSPHRKWRRHIADERLAYAMAGVRY